MADPTHGPIGSGDAVLYIEAYSGSPSYGSAAVIADVQNIEFQDVSENQKYASSSTSKKYRRIPGYGDVGFGFDILPTSGALKWDFNKGAYVCVKIEASSGVGITNADMIIGDIRGMLKPGTGELIGLHVEVEGDGTDWVAIP